MTHYCPACELTFDEGPSSYQYIDHLEWHLRQDAQGGGGGHREEKCERCGGKGDIYWIGPVSNERQNRVCPDCRGTGKRAGGGE